MSLGRAFPPQEGPPPPECQICYEPFDRQARRPKLLWCGHGLCARCLLRMAEAGGDSSSSSASPPPGGLRCPFCRQETPLPEKDVGRLRDDGPLLAALLSGRRGGAPPSSSSSSPELLLCPGGVLEPLRGSRSGSSDCLVVTLLEVPEGELGAPEWAAGAGLLEVMRLSRPPSLASALPCPPPLAACPAFPRLLLGLLCLGYFSSLPLGIYLLLVERLRLGVALVSLVPATLLLCVLYGLCQCLRHELCAPAAAAAPDWPHS